jgi:hypothetical protein
MERSRLDLLRKRVGRDVEVFRLEPEQQVPHAAADEERLKARLPQPVENAQRVRGDVGTAACGAVEGFKACFGLEG